MVVVVDVAIGGDGVEMGSGVSCACCHGGVSQSADVASQECMILSFLSLSLSPAPKVPFRESEDLDLMSIIS